MKPIPTEVYQREFKANGCQGRMIKKYSYVVVLCERKGGDVKAVRYDGYTSKTDLYKVVDADHPGWKIKGVWRLYEEDFDLE